jgi:hypothetical protein
MGMYEPIMARDIAPADNLATHNGHEPWVASRDTVRYEPSGLIERWRFKEGQVLSLA